MGLRVQGWYRPFFNSSYLGSKLRLGHVGRLSDMQYNHEPGRRTRASRRPAVRGGFAEAWDVSL